MLGPLLLLSALPSAADDVNPQEPQRTELVERAETRLTQIDVSVSGPQQLLEALGPEDFELKINLKRMREFTLDRFCEPAPADGPLTLPVAYLLYFDQTHLTLPGRANSLDVARRLVRRLIGEGQRAMIVSNARRLEVVQELTDEPDRLLEALDRLEQDRTQWDSFATEEESRVGRVVDALNDDDDTHRAISAARSFQREERWRSDKALRRLALTLGRLSDVDSRKVVFYFADTLRSNAGEHYLTFFGTRLRQATPQLSEMTLDTLAAGLAFDQVVNAATAQGIRFYPVHAQGLIMAADTSQVSGDAIARTGAISSSSRVRFRDAQNTLDSLASETGGRAFLRGDSAQRIAEQIRADFSCLFTISFDPTGFAEDAPLRAIVKVLHDGVTIRSRGRVVIESESTRLAARLLSAFSSNRPGDTAVGLQANLVPTGFRSGTYSALLQVSVPGTQLVGAEWELGASMYSRDKVTEEVSGSIAVKRPGVPLILEQEVALKPGPHEIVAVAHELTTDFIFSEHVDVSWPDPDRQPATCGPIALLQPTPGAFLRSGATRTGGSLARSDSDVASTDLPTALMALVCRSKRHKGALQVERSLRGASVVDFPRLEFDLGKERCAQIRDLIPAYSMGPGFYRYTVRVRQGETTLHEGTREFAAVSPAR